MKQHRLGKNRTIRMRFYIAAFILVLTGCADGPKPAPKAAESPRLPRILHFYGNQAIVPKGGSLTLCYGTENVDTVILTPYDDGELRPSLNRCVAHSPKSDTTYTLTAKGPGGETTASFSVRVGAAAPKEKVLIQNFQSVGATPIAPGAPIKLCYSTDGASSVSVTPSAGGAVEPGANQCFTVSPSKTTTYVLTARSTDGGVDRMQVTVPVQ